MSRTRHFCTLFDRTYLFKGVAMLDSLARHCPGAQVFVLCMDDETQRILQQLAIPGVRCIALGELETPELLAAKADRGIAEYCWTLSPSLPWYVLQRWPEVDEITYLDADLLFYSSPEPVFAEIGDAPIAIIEHRFIDRLKDQEIKGRFCVEWVGFRRTEEGLACLDRWRRQCIDWCYYRLEDDGAGGMRYGDQKYLDAWPGRFPGCHVIQHPGAGVAPFNYARYRHSVGTDGVPTVDGVPLVFYHFHQFQLMSNGRFNRLSEFYTVEQPEPERVYRIYEQAMLEAVQRIQSVAPGFTAGFKPAHRVVLRRWAQRFMPRPMRHLFHRVFGY
jgi:hypothetical protein